MNLVLESTLNCLCCKIQDEKKITFNPGDNAERMAKIAERELVEKHIEGHPECISDFEISTTSRVIDTETNKVIWSVESGLNIARVIDDLDPEPIGEEFLEDSFEFPDEIVNPVGFVADFS